MTTSKTIMCRRCRCEWVEDKLCAASSFSVICDPDVESKVDHPSHYRADTGVEAITVIEAWGLNFNLGNVVLSSASEEGA